MRRSLLRIILPVLTVTVGACGADQPVMMNFTVADGARLMQRWDDSIYAKLWNDRALQATRAKVAEQLDKIEKELGFKPLDLLAALKSCDIKLDDLVMRDGQNALTGKANPPSARMSMQLDVGDFAAKLFSLIREKSPEAPVVATVAGADEALTTNPTSDKPDHVTIARFGSRLIVAMNQDHPPAIYTVKTDDADARVTVDYRALIAAAAKASQDHKQQANFAVIKMLDQFLTPLQWEMTLVPEGVRERISQNRRQPGVRPVDRTLLNRLPATTLMAVAFGIDSKDYWNVLEPVVLEAAVQQGTAITHEQLVSQTEQALKKMGLAVTFADLTTAIDGSILLAVTPGAPFPALTIAVPRSKTVDQLVRFAATNLQWEIPADGASSPVAIPNVPLPITLIADPGYWVVTSDPSLATTWNAGGPGWSESAAGKLALAQAPEGTYMIGASDTPAVLRTAGGFLALIPFNDAKDKQMATVLLARASAAAATGYLVGHHKGKDHWEMEARGLFGFGAVPAIMAAIAIPNLLQSRNKANESAVASHLKSAVFPAQIQFQAGAYIDQNGDNIGEYGFLAEMAGGAVTGQPDTLKLSFLPNTWNTAQPEMNGYRFSCFLPDGKGGAIEASDGARAQNAAAAKAQSEHFVVYAWPTDRTKNAPIYALTQSGSVYSTAADKLAAQLSERGPAWNALFGDAGWDGTPTWETYRRK
jgi:hypothetical protein